MKVICISGKAQSGKDTTAFCLKTILEREHQRVLVAHFADLLKYICKTFFKWNGVKDDRGRELFQRVGTDKIRAASPDYWVNFIAGMLVFFGDEWDYVLIPDCRFPNEYEVLKSYGFDVTLMRVTRPSFTSPLTPEQQNHPSETALDNYKWDCEIHNRGTVRDLFLTCNHLLHNTPIGIESHDDSV